MNYSYQIQNQLYPRIRTKSGRDTVNPEFSDADVRNIHDHITINVTIRFYPQG